MARYDLRTLEVSGSPRELGRQQGEAFRSEVEQFVEMRTAAVQRYFADRGQPERWEQVLEVGAKSLAIFESWDPAGHAEHLGIAEGANADPSRLFTINNMTDMRDAVLLSAASGPPLGGPSEGGMAPGDMACSSVLVPASHTETGEVLAGQTWDLNPTDLEYVVAIHRRPSEGPQTWSVTCTGCLSLLAINEHGLAVGTTNIKVYGSRPGVGYLSLLHRLARATDVSEGSEIVRSAPHAGAHTYWLADRQSLVEYEASPNGTFERDPGGKAMARTNHCLFKAHQDIQGELPGDSSKSRLSRMGEILQNKQSVDSLKALFADRSDGVLSINRYPEDDQGTATNAVFIAEPASRKAWACRGPSDRGNWLELAF